MTPYIAVYWLHVTSVIVSGSFFLVRGIWMLMESNLLNHRFVRIAPHVNDTVLLSAAIGLAVMSGQYPFMQDWLTAKFFALVAYIILGIYALRQGATKPVRAICLVLALLTYMYLVSVALSRSPLGFLVYL